MFLVPKESLCFKEKPKPLDTNSQQAVQILTGKIVLVFVVGAPWKSLEKLDATLKSPRPFSDSKLPGTC